MSDLTDRLRQRHGNRENPWGWQEAIEAYERERNEAADRIEQLEKALSPFTFPAYPKQFDSPDGGCTEAIVCDADVQIARAVNQ